MFYLAPNGIRNPVGDRFWKGTDACCDFLDMGWDDSQYLMNLVDEVSAKYPIDQTRIYFIGHSNGGFLAHRLACEHSDRIAAIVTFAGMQYRDITKCKPKNPVSVLHIHGTADELINFNGDVLIEVAFPGADETVADWITLNGCTANSLAP
jgi:polyhydroxybutyrate depolymerase